MLNDYLIIKKDVLPEIFLKVIKVKEIINKGQYSQVSKAVKHVGISRSAYYKYKDHIYTINKTNIQSKAILIFTLSDKKGTLSTVLKLLSKLKCNIININQNNPISSLAKVTITIDISEMNINIESLIQAITKLNGVTKVHLESLE